MYSFEISSVFAALHTDTQQKQIQNKSSNVEHDDMLQ